MPQPVRDHRPQRAWSPLGRPVPPRALVPSLPLQRACQLLLPQRRAPDRPSQPRRAPKVLRLRAASRRGAFATLAEATVFADGTRFADGTGWADTEGGAVGASTAAASAAATFGAVAVSAGATSSAAAAATTAAGAVSAFASTTDAADGERRPKRSSWEFRRQHRSGVSQPRTDVARSRARFVHSCSDRHRRRGSHCRQRPRLHGRRDRGRRQDIARCSAECIHRRCDRGRDPDRLCR